MSSYHSSSAINAGALVLFLCTSFRYVYHLLNFDKEDFKAISNQLLNVTRSCLEVRS